MRFKRSQIKAATKVNEKMLLFYWELGRDIEAIKPQNLYGTNFYEKISKDLTKELPDSNMQQVVAKSEMRNIFRIPWGHHICILNKCKGNSGYFRTC